MMPGRRMIYGVDIRDQKASGRRLAIDTVDLLKHLVGLAPSLKWSVSGLEVLGPADEALYHMEEQESRLEAHVILHLFSGIHQTIDGDIDGYDADASEPTVTIRAIDSTSFAVESPKRDLVEAIAGLYRNVHRYEFDPDVDRDGGGEG